MTECNAIIEANKEIDKLKRENEKLNALCVEYGFEMGKLEEENKQLKQRNKQKDKQLQDIKNLIKNSMETERTPIGYNTLKQLWEAIKE